MGWGVAGILSETACKPANAKPKAGGIVLDRDGFVVVFMEVDDRRVHLPCHMVGFLPCFLFAQSAEGDKEEAKAANAGFFVVRFTSL